jgi:hypothetical protein
MKLDYLDARLKKLEKIRVTEKVIDEVNYLQTGGTMAAEDFTDERFDNSGLEDRLKDLTLLNDFLLELMNNGEMQEIHNEEVLRQLRVINLLKQCFEKFRV